jgi:glycosyltransferase involved in cell wall biosynthesis
MPQRTTRQLEREKPTMVSNRDSILYLTQNGVTDHIGRSQVAPYLLGLARKGFKIHVLSAEKPGREVLVRAYQQQFTDVGIRWWRTSYRTKPPIAGQVWTQMRLQYLAERIARNHPIALVHCRSHPTALIGEHIFDQLGIPFIFDFRDFYANGGLEKTKGLRRLLFQRVKTREGVMIRKSAHVVCLTQRAQQVLSNWYLTDQRESKTCFTIIPCCADFNHFDPSLITEEEKEATRSSLKIAPNTRVLAYLGALGEDYLLEPMLRLFKQLLLIDPNSVFLFVVNNGADLVASACERLKVPIEKIRFIGVGRENVPRFISLATLSVFFYRPGLRSSGCSPTKLAELFAMNVPVIANSGVGDLDAIISLEANGSRIVEDFQDETLQKAVQDVLTWKQKKPLQIRISSSAFDLPTAVSRYAAIYQDLLEA